MQKDEEARGLALGVAAVLADLLREMLEAELLPEQVISDSLRASELTLLKLQSAQGAAGARVVGTIRQIFMKPRA